MEDFDASQRLLPLTTIVSDTGTPDFFYPTGIAMALAKVLYEFPWGGGDGLSFRSAIFSFFFSSIYGVSELAHFHSHTYENYVIVTILQF